MIYFLLEYCFRNIMIYIFRCLFLFIVSYPPLPNTSTPANDRPKQYEKISCPKVIPYFHTFKTIDTTINKPYSVVIYLNTSFLKYFFEFLYSYEFDYVF